VTFTQPQPHLAGKRGEEILVQSAEQLAGNLRWGVERDEVVLIGEVRTAPGVLSFTEAKARLVSLARATPGFEKGMPELEDLGCALGHTGVDWSQRDGQWVASLLVGRDQRCELTATPQGDGMVVETVLANWEDDPSLECRTALAHFLVQAHSRLRFVRFVLGRHEVRAVSVALADRLDVEMPDSTFGVAAAYRLLHRETKALLGADLARAYLARARLCPPLAHPQGVGK
jgi:hypothetical protein